jgi:DNA-binding HxlR family transcriptional regulator
MLHNHPDYHCPVDATLGMIGGKYKSLILWHLVDATLRFGELRKLIGRVTPKMLTQHLRELEESGLVVRTVYPVVPPKVEYSLTELGLSIKPVLAAMYDWGASYLKSHGIEACCSMTSKPYERFVK